MCFPLKSTKAPSNQTSASKCTTCSTLQEHQPNSHPKLTKHNVVLLSTIRDCKNRADCRDRERDRNRDRDRDRVAGRLCAFERKTHATDKLRFARVRLGSIFLNRSEARLCLFFFQFGVSEHPMFLCANQNHYATTFCIIVCDGVSKHFGPTSVPTYRSSSPKLA